MEKNVREGIENVLDEVLSRHSDLTHTKRIGQIAKPAKNYTVGQAMWNNVHKSAKNDINLLFQQVNAEIDSILNFARSNNPSELEGNDGADNQQSANAAEGFNQKDRKILNHLVATPFLTAKPDSDSKSSKDSNDINMSKLLRGEFSSSIPSSDLRDLDDSQDSGFSKKKYYLKPHSFKKSHRHNRFNNENALIEHATYSDDFYKDYNNSKRDVSMDYLDALDLDDARDNKDFVYPSYSSANPFANYDAGTFINGEQAPVYDADSVAGQLTKALNLDKYQAGSVQPPINIVTVSSSIPQRPAGLKPLFGYQPTTIIKPINVKLELSIPQPNGTGATKIIDNQTLIPIANTTTYVTAPLLTSAAFGNGGELVTSAVYATREIGNEEIVSPEIHNNAPVYAAGPTFESAVDDYRAYATQSISHTAPVAEAAPAPTPTPVVNNQWQQPTQPFAQPVSQMPHQVATTPVTKPAPVFASHAIPTQPIVEQQPVEEEPAPAMVQPQPEPEPVFVSQPEPAPVVEEEPAPTVEPLVEETAQQQEPEPEFVNEQPEPELEPEPAPVAEEEPAPAAVQPEPEPAPVVEEEPAPAAEEGEPYYLQFVGNPDYGYYDELSNWVWTGYFDDNNNWISTAEDKPAQQSVEESNAEIDDLFAFNPDEETEDLEDTKKKKKKNKKDKKNKK